MYELELTCDVDASGKWGYLALDNIVVAPVPAGTTPLVTMHEHVEEPATTNIYRVTGGSVNFRKGPGMSYKIMKVLHKDDLVTLVNKKGPHWYKIIDKTGTSGYMWHEYLTFHKKETSTPIGSSETVSVDPHTVRDQPFRIYDIIPGLNQITVRARHLFYDLADNMILSAKFKKVAGNIAGPLLFDSCVSAHDFDFYTDITKKKSAEFAEVSPVEALLGDQGYIDVWGGELMRDWYEVFVMKKLGKNRNVTVRYGKNLLSIGGSQSNDNAVSRIIPVGQTKDGKPLYLPEKFIESKSKASFPHPRYAILKVEDAKEHENKKDPNDKDNPTVTKAQCYTLMRDAAAEEFENGADLMDLSLNIDFVMLENTVEYRDFAALQDIFLGDTVKVMVERLGLEISLRMTEYVFNCLTRQYESITLGQATGNVATGISPRQLPNGKISGTKLGYGSVNGSALQDGAVGALKIGEAAIQSAHIEYAAIQSAHIEDAAITTAKIGTATIDELYAGSIDALSARIQDLVAGNITTDTLYAALATIAVAQITTANIDKANIDWAKIQTLLVDSAHIRDLAVTTAKIANAAITNAQIENGTIQTANIALGAITTALIEVGAVGTAQIADASISDAKIVELTANKINAGTLSVERLVIVGPYHSIVYTINEANGTPQLSGETIDGGSLTQRSITADRIVAEAITAREIAAFTIVANNIAANAITAAKLDADAVEARHIQAGSIDTSKVTANFGESLNLSSNHSIRLAVSDAVDTAAKEIVGQQLALTFSRGTYLDDDNQETVVAAKVYAGGKNITDKVPAECFVWEMVSGNPERDATFSASFSGLKNFTLTTALVDFTAVIRCHIEIERMFPRFSLDRGDLFLTQLGTEADTKLWMDGQDLHTDAFEYVLYDDGNLYITGHDIGTAPTEATVVDRTDDPYTAKLSADITVAKGEIALKASQTDVDSMGQAVATHTSQIELTKGQIALKASQTDLNAMGETVATHSSDIELTKGQIALKASQTDVSALGKRMTDAEQIITPTAITQTVKDSGSLELAIVKQGTAPSAPAVGQLWCDTSVTPNTMKRWTGSVWMNTAYDKAGVQSLIEQSATQVKMAFGQVGGANLIKGSNHGGLASTVLGTGWALWGNTTLSSLAAGDGGNFAERGWNPRQAAGTGDSFGLVTPRNITLVQGQKYTLSVAVRSWYNPSLSIKSTRVQEGEGRSAFE